MLKLNVDKTSKIISIVSVLFAIIVSVGGFFTSLKAHKLGEQLQQLEASNKALENSKQEYNSSPRITAKFELPLARAFAEEYLDKAQTGEPVKYAIPTPELSEEMVNTIPNWKKRRGLMTGQACGQEGLKARQVVTLLIKNIGYADAIEVEITAKQKICPSGNPLKGWRQLSERQKEVGYAQLAPAVDNWTTVSFGVEDLLGQGSPKNEINEAHIVLASVSGNTYYGTVLVPTSISWKNKMTNKRETQQISGSETGRIRAKLIGAELGNLGSICP